MIVTMNKLFSLFVLVSLCLIVHSQEDPCGTTHGCFRDPPGCYPPSECTYYVSWTGNTADSSLVDFEVSVDVGSGDKYAAMGLSQNDQMPESDIYMCRSNQTMVGYYPSSKSITSADERELKGISNEVVDPIVDGDLHCTFSRMIDLTETDPEFFSLNDDLYVLVAFGELSGNTPSYHTGAGRWLTSDPVDLLDVGLKASDDDPCGKTHGCYRDPENCYPPSECTYYVSWTGNTADSSLVDFEVSVDVGSGDKYAAMGLSQNDQMSDSDIYMCRSDQTMVGYYPSSKSISSADERELKGISNEVVDPIVDGDLHCTFSRMIELDEDDPEFFSMNDDLYVLVAFGELSGGTTPSYHTGAGRFLTSEPVDLLDTSSAETDLKLPRARKAHASLMVIGWMGFASTGIMFARYMKPFMSEQTLCGNKVWFNSHRINMISAFACFVSAFIVIFAVKKEFVDSEIRVIYAHGIIGCIAVGLGVINPIMAIFRPHPGTPNRPIFNYAHRTVGILGWTFAMVAILLASDFYFDFARESITDVNAFWTITVFLIIGVVIIILFEVFECTVAQQDSAPSADIALRQPGDQVSTVTVPPTAHPAERWRSMIFSLALLDILICTIVMVVFIIQVEI